MSDPVFLATLGQRPEAITMALDHLLARYHYTEVSILHTDPDLSGIAESFTLLRAVLERDYAELVIHHEEIRALGGAPLIDISDQMSAEAY